MSGLFPAKTPMSPSNASLASAEDTQITLRDRATPIWSVAVSALFSMGGGLCLLATAVFFIFMYDEVAMNGQKLLAGLLAACALVPILGVFIFDVCHARALSGLRYIRRRNDAVGRALVGAVAGGVFALLDPLLAIPFLCSALLSWLVCRYATRLLQTEPLWAFDTQEAVSLLTGRDQRAVDLVQAENGESPLLVALLKVFALAALVASIAIASWLVAVGRLNVAAILTIAFVTYWSADAFGTFFQQISRADPEHLKRAKSVALTHPPFSDDPASDEAAFVVHDLSVHTARSAPLLSNISFRAEPGTIIGLCGDSFAGKSLLLRALQAPHDLQDLFVRGYVGLRGTAMWGRTAHNSPLQSVLLPPQPIVAPGSGAQNITCFGGPDHLARARRALQSLVFTADTIERILTTKDISTLSTSEQKALSIARVLALRPPLYLIDRPEDGASDAMIHALGERLRTDARHGHIVLIATENRALLDQCDQLLMMQNGRVIELAATADIRARQSSGVSRFTAPRELESEDALDGWICSHFRRDGDEANRRAVCMVANEILSLACQTSGDTAEAADELTFEFKHFTGKCEIRLIDSRLSLSSGALKKAEKAAATSVEGERLSPLAKIMRDSLSVETSQTNGTSFLHVSIKTYDPRLLTQRKADQNAATKA